MALANYDRQDAPGVIRNVDGKIPRHLSYQNGHLSAAPSCRRRRKSMEHEIRILWRASPTPSTIWLFCIWSNDSCWITWNREPKYSAHKKHWRAKEKIMFRHYVCMCVCEINRVTLHIWAVFCWIVLNKMRCSYL